MQFYQTRSNAIILYNALSKVCTEKVVHMQLREELYSKIYQSPEQQQEDTRKEAVKKLIHQFEIHPNCEALKADLEKDQAFKPFSEKSKDMTRSMGNTEYSEMCEMNSKVQCPNCLIFWATRIENCTCGTCLRPSDKNRKFNKDRFDVSSNRTTC